MTDEAREYRDVFDRDSDTPAFRLERLSLRLSHLIFQAMLSRGMSRTEFARALGVSPPMVTKILSGRSNFTLKTLVEVAGVLGCEFDVVLSPAGCPVATEQLLVREVLEDARERKLDQT